MLYQQTYEERRSFGEALRRKRLSLRVSQEQLAREAKISANTISQYEVNGMSPTLITALNIAFILGWNIEKWEEDAAAILRDGSWKTAPVRRERKRKDDDS